MQCTVNAGNVYKAEEKQKKPRKINSIITRPKCRVTKQDWQWQRSKVRGLSTRSVVCIPLYCDLHVGSVPQKQAAMTALCSEGKLWPVFIHVGSAVAADELQDVSGPQKAAGKRSWHIHTITVFIPHRPVWYF